MNKCEKCGQECGGMACVPCGRWQGTGQATSDRAGKTPQEIISEHMRALQKKSAEARKKNDPNTYKKMVKLRWEKKEDLLITLE